MQSTIIPFNIRTSVMNCKGEVEGNSLEDMSMFKVNIKGNQPFYIQAVPDNDLHRYEWTSYLDGESKKLVPVIGKIIERYYSKQK